MNIRFSTNEIRIRLDQHEMKSLLENGRLSLTTRIPDAEPLVFNLNIRSDIRSENMTLIDLKKQGGQFNFEILKSSLAIFDGSEQPSRDAKVEQVLKGDGGELLTIVLEVDIFARKK